MGKTRRTGDLVNDNNLYVNPTDDSFHVGTGITMYGGSVGIISCTELYLGGTAMAAGLISRVSSRVVATDGQTAFTVSTYDSDIVDVTNNQITIPNHFFVTGEEVEYSIAQPIVGCTTTGIGSTGDAIGIAATPSTSPANVTYVPSSVFIIKVSDSVVKLAATAENALKSITVPL